MEVLLSYRHYPRALSDARLVTIEGGVALPLPSLFDPVRVVVPVSSLPIGCFFPLLLGLIKVQVHLFFGCPCAQPEREILSFFRRILGRRSLEFLRRKKPSDAMEYRRLLAQYESELLALISKTREHVSSLLLKYKEEK